MNSYDLYIKYSINDLIHILMFSVIVYSVFKIKLDPTLRYD